MQGNYVKTATLILFIFILPYTIFTYNPTLVTNTLCFFIWWLKDTVIYYSLFLITLTSFLINFIFEKVYVYSSGWVFSEQQKKYVKDEKTKLKYPTSNTFKYFYFSWLKQENVFNNHQSLNKLSTTNLTEDQPLTNLLLPKSLYQIIPFIQKTRTGTNSYLSTSQSKYLELPFKKKIPLNLALKNASKSETLYLTQQPSLRFLHLRPNWHFDKIQKGAASNVTYNKKGLIYSNTLTFSSYNRLWLLNQDPHFLLEFINNQVQVLKSSRFLYNYSFIHRKALKNSHKLTTIKKLLSSGFYNSNLIFKNIWASDFFNKVTSPELLLKNEVELIYSNLFKTPLNNTSNLGQISINQTLNNLKHFSNYEESYFWFLKRFYLFNNLKSNKTTLVTLPLRADVLKSENPWTTYLLHLTNLYKSNLLLNRNFTSYSCIDNSTTANSLINNKTTSFQKNIIYLNQESELLNNEDEFLMTEIISSNSQKMPKYSFFRNLNVRYKRKNLMSLKKLSTPQTSDNSYFTAQQALYLNDLISIGKFL